MPVAPQQARSRKTMERIVNAALTVVAERGADEATIQEIVRKARSSVGSFYSRFEGKDELIAYLQEQVWDDALDRWREALGGDSAGGSLGDAIELVVATLLDDREGHRLRIRAFGLSFAGDAPEAVRLFRRGVLDLVRARLSPHIVEIGHPEPMLAIGLGFLATTGALEQLDRDVAHDLDDETLARELNRIYRGYLAGETGYASSSSDDPQFADPFDVWT